MRELARPLTLEQAWLWAHEHDALAGGAQGAGGGDARAPDDSWDEGAMRERAAAMQPPTPHSSVGERAHLVDAARATRYA